MANTLTRLERAPGWRPTKLCTALFVAPALLALAAHLLAGALTKAPVDAGSFRPDSLVTMVSLSMAVIYAAVFMVLMYQLRTPGVSTFSKTARRGDITTGTVIAMGFMVGGMVALFGSLGVGSAINLAVGQVVFEPGTIRGKSVTQGKGCHFHIVVVSDTVPGGRGLCVSQPNWYLLQDGDSLPLVTITSAVGQQVGLAPDALSHVEGHAR